MWFLTKRPFCGTIGIVTGNDTDMERQRTIMKNNVTIHDVAHAAGVSVSTVSRVLNGKEDVSAKTLAHVQQVIEELGYISSLAARSMRSRKTGVIGLIVPDVEQPFVVDLLKGINRTISSHHSDLLLYTSGKVRAGETSQREKQYVSLLNNGLTDGVMIVTPSATNFSTAGPVVAIDPNVESPSCPAVIATNYAGALAAMRYLIRLGHRRIGFISGRNDLLSAKRRELGYIHGLTEAGIEIDEALMQQGDYRSETAVSCAIALLDLPRRPTAIFAANDESALAVYRVATARGLRIPDDLSVVGFDNIAQAAYLRPALTTVDQSVPELGKAATEMLLQLLDGEPPSSALLKVETELVVRESCRMIFD